MTATTAAATWLLGRPRTRDDKQRAPRTVNQRFTGSAQEDARHEPPASRSDDDQIDLVRELKQGCVAALYAAGLPAYPAWSSSTISRSNGMRGLVRMLGSL